MGEEKIRSLRGGANQSGLRDHNERLLLSMLQRNGAMPGSDLARRTGLSPQTVSVILRKLENDELLERGTPSRGKVGKPSIPMELSPSGVFSFGLKIGRRGADLLLMDFTGGIRQLLQISYDYPMPELVFDFLESGMATITANLKPAEVERICGLGIATPFEIWNWNELVGAPEEEFSSWKSVNFKSAVSEFSDLPTYVVNDATAACRAEHVYGRGKEFRDFAYFYLAAFIGGGIVLNHTVFEGHQGNAGALGSLPGIGAEGESRQLIDIASVHLLEVQLHQANLDTKLLWRHPQNWDSLSRFVEPWIEKTALQLAKASLAVCSVIDFEAVLIDGALPLNVKEKLVNRTRSFLADQDARGLIPPTIEMGVVGENSRAIGAACGPVFSQFFLNTHVGFSEI